jgi:hypothetical protein
LAQIDFFIFSTIFMAILLGYLLRDFMQGCVLLGFATLIVQGM